MNSFDEIMGWKLMDWMKALIIIGIVVGLGLFCVNQYMEFRYSAYLLSTPCDLCRELNPQVDGCFYNMIDNPNKNIKNINISKINLTSLLS